MNCFSRQHRLGSGFGFCFLMVLVLGVVVPVVAEGDDGGLKMWFSKPAESYGLKSPLQSWNVENPKRTHKPNPDQAWEKYALPMGNGFVGAMIYGGTSYERVQLNEHTLWSGGPGSEGWKKDLNYPGAHKHMGEIRRLLLAGDKKKAQALSTEYLRGLDVDDRNAADVRFGRYETLGELIIETGHGKYEEGMGYRRELDLSTGIHRVKYAYDGVNYFRETFCSNPDRVLVMRFGGDQKGKQNLKLKFYSPHVIEASGVEGVFVARGYVKNNGLKLDMRIGILHEGGVVKIEGDAIVVEGADRVTFVLVAGTDYKAVFPTYRGADPSIENKKRLAEAMGKGYPVLEFRHIADHAGMHNRVSVDWGKTSDAVLKLPLDERMKLNKKKADHDLEELYFQFARYLLMGSSRPGGVPANLQGIWCNEVIPAWNADYHLNINLQMNYWPSGPTNLIECQKPLIDYTDALRVPGAVTAKAYHNARGWTANLSSNLWGYTNPHSGKNRPRYWAYFPMAGAWLSTHAFEQYAFGMDEKYLREKSWPILSGTADFLVDMLFELPSGEVTSAPSWSPEHGPISVGATCDIAMAREAFKDAIYAAGVLGEKGERVDAWRAAMDKLVPYKVGRLGQLQEWYEDIDNPKDKHRHLNHLFGLHPGSQISPVHTPKLAAAAKATLTMRGDGATGWSMGWKINFWARVHDGDHAYLMIRNLLKRGTNPNLFDVHAPFQIDGNFGGCAGMAEMLMQSHYRVGGGEIDLLPALPRAWGNGSFKGLVARGGFVVDLKWIDGKATGVEVLSKKGGKLIVRSGGRVWERAMKAGEVWVIKG